LACRLVNALVNQGRFRDAFADQEKWFLPAPVLFRQGCPDETKQAISAVKTRQGGKGFEDRGKIKTADSREPLPLARAHGAG
jgi:hypothetical protein